MSGSEFLKLLLENFEGVLRDIKALPRPRRYFTCVAAVALALLAIATFIVGSKAGAEWLGLLGIPFMGFIALRIWVKPDEVARINSALLAGPSPIRIREGAFVKSWGRQDEIAELAEWISTEKVAAVLLWGAPAVGKTSLVDSGLRADLASGHQFISIDASQDNFEEVLVDRLREGSENVPRTLDQIILKDRGRKQVVVLDNASLVHGERLKRLSQIIKLAVAQNGPYKRIFIVILDDREYADEWRDQTWKPKSREALKRRQVESFTLGQAIDVALSMKKSAFLPVEDEVLEAGVRELSFPNPAPGQEALVSPLALGTFVWLIAREAVGGREIGMDEYLAAGRAVGLMRAHLTSRLFTLAPQSWREILAKIAEAGGGSASFRRDAFGSLPAPQELELNAALEGLSSSDLRVLRFDPARGEYRVVQAWAPVVDEMTSAPDPFVSAAEEFLKQRFLDWERRTDEAYAAGQARRFWNRRYGVVRGLLSRSDLKIADSPDKPLKLPPHITRYVALSREYRRLQRSLAWGLIVLLIPALVVGFRWVRGWNQIEVQAAWGLPDDFGKRKDQLTSLAFESGCMIDQLAWLPRKLKRLEIPCDRIETLKAVPPSLTHLNARSTSIRDLADLPPTVTNLDLSSTGLKGDVPLGELNLTALNLTSLRILNMKLLPRTLTALTLSHADIDNLEGLPESLTTLDLSGTSVRSLKTLPPGLLTLKLNLNAMKRIDYLPPHLDALETDKLMEDGKELPSSLRKLKASRIPLLVVPPDLTSLELDAVPKVGELPAGLERLWINGTPQPVTLDKLPPGLKKLKMLWPDGARFESLPRSLQVLDLSGSFNVTELTGLQAPVTDLNLTSTGVTSLRALPDRITRLTYQFCPMAEVKELPSHLVTLDLSACTELDLLDHLPSSLQELNIRKTRIASLPKLPDGLRKLDISNSKVRSLPELPSKLEELTIHLGQLKSLKGMPGSVRKITFVAREKDGVVETPNP